MLESCEAVTSSLSHSALVREGAGEEGGGRGGTLRIGGHRTHGWIFAYSRCGNHYQPYPTACSITCVNVGFMDWYRNTPVIHCCSASFPPPLLYAILHAPLYMSYRLTHISPVINRMMIHSRVSDLRFCSTSRKKRTLC